MNNFEWWLCIKVSLTTGTYWVVVKKDHEAREGSPLPSWLRSQVGEELLKVLNTCLLDGFNFGRKKRIQSIHLNAPHHSEPTESSVLHWGINRFSERGPGLGQFHPAMN